MKQTLCSAVLLALLCSLSEAKVAVVFRLASPPLPVEPGQHFSLCASNVGTVNIDLTLQFINVRTGAVVATRDVTLPPAGTNSAPFDPCLETSSTAFPASNSGASPLLVALAVVKRGLFSRVSAATASVQVSTPDTSGVPHTVASIPLHLATLINGRNTPIERVK